MACAVTLLVAFTVYFVMSFAMREGPLEGPTGGGHRPHERRRRRAAAGQAARHVDAGPADRAGHLLDRRHRGADRDLGATGTRNTTFKPQD